MYKGVNLYILRNAPERNVLMRIIEQVHPKVQERNDLDEKKTTLAIRKMSFDLQSHNDKWFIRYPSRILI